MSFVLIEKLLVGAVDGDAANAIHDNLKLMRECPVEGFTNVWNHLYPALADNQAPGHFAAINGILLGISLANGLVVSDQLKRYILEYIDERSKAMGGHVIDFYEARAGRRPC